MTAGFRAVVLAGERPGGGDLAKALHAPCGAMVQVAGQTCLQRVLACLQTSEHALPGVVCGPDAAIVDAHPEHMAHLEAMGYTWLAPRMGPAASALAAAEAAAQLPIVITTADHALLRAPVVDAFLQACDAMQDCDFAIGLVPFERVMAEFPATNRTVLKFKQRPLCGSNLFAVLSPRGKRALAFWQRVESLRKRPLQIAAHLGLTTLLRYALGRLTVEDAMERLSKLAGCRIGWVCIDEPRAAIDVDSMADWTLAQELLSAPVATVVR